MDAPIEPRKSTMSVSLNPFSRCFRTEPEPTPLDQALPLLQTAGLDTPTNRKKIQSEWSQKIVAFLAESDLLTQPNIDKLLLGESDGLVTKALSELVSPGRPVPVPIRILQREIDTIFPTPESVPDACMALHFLHKVYLTRPVNFVIFSLGGDVATGLGLLASKGLLTERNLDAVIAYPWMGTAFSDKMAEWDSVGMLTQKQLDDFLHTEDLDTDIGPLIQNCCINIAEGKSASVEHRQCAIRLMRTFGILTPENRLDILAHPDRALFIAMLYGWLDRGNILNPVNKDIVLNQLSIKDCEYISGSTWLVFQLCADLTNLPQLATQEIFDRLVEKPTITIKVLPLFAYLVNAEVFTPEMPAEVFSQLRDIDSLVNAVGILVDDKSLNKDSFADLMANPRHALEIAAQIVCGLDRSAREQIAQGQATAKLLKHPGCIKLKKSVLGLLKALNIGGSKNQTIVAEMHPLVASRVIGGLVYLQQGLVTMRRMVQMVSIPTLLPTEMEAIESFQQKVFEDIVEHPEHALPMAQIHLTLEAKIPPEYHKACFTHLENLRDIALGVELLGRYELLNPENLMQFLSDNQAHVSKIVELLTKCRSLDQARFARIVTSVRSGEAISAQSLDLDVGLRRRLPGQRHEMKV
jgi:hypothetical protein